MGVQAIGMVVTAALVLAAAGCGDDADTTGQGGATSSVTSSAQTGGGGMGGGGLGGIPDVEPCGPPAPPVQTQCPSECTGGCADQVCLILCDQEQSCNFPMTCPPGMDCQVTCTGGGSCRVQLTCDDSYQCSVTCTGDQACRGLTVSCGSVGRCGMVCGTHAETCQGADLICGGGECEAQCFPPAAQPTVECGSSCSCTACM
jgi:hypothetical protein